MHDKIMHIHAGWLIDGSGAAVQKKMRIDLLDGMIQSVCKIAHALLPSSEKGASVLDLSDGTLMPGRVDCHVHLALSASAPQRPPDDSLADAHSRIIKHLYEHLAYGVMACATSHAATLLGLHERGRLRPHMQTNLIAARGDPSQLPESLSEVEQVIYKGNLINSYSIDIK